MNSVDLNREVVQLNDDRERGDPLCYRVDHTGTVVVENSNREVYVEKYTAAETNRPGISFPASVGSAEMRPIRRAKEN